MATEQFITVAIPAYPTSYHAKGKFKDLTGQEYGRLKVLCYAGSVGGKGRSRWLCRCSCGNLVTIATKAFWNDNTESCGCLKVEIQAGRISALSTTHAKSKTPEYSVWTAMLSRCRNKNSKSYCEYGGRGITVCESWLKFENFLADMGPRPDGYSIERDDVNGNYEPGNCRWVPRSQQPLNTRRNVFVTIEGAKKTVSEWAREYGREPGLVHARLRAGWEAIKALETPPGPSGRREATDSGD